MIHDVDESLRELVRRDVLDGAKVDVSFDAPTKEWAAKRSGPALSLYLYEIREDLSRRRVQYEEERDDDGNVVDRRMPPRKFKLSYLVTAWTQRPEDEHRLLSAVLAAFLTSDELPRDLLQGDLAEQPDAVRTTIALPLPAERSVADIWSALGGELKPSLDLVVTVPFPAVRGRTLPIGPPVTEDPRIDVVGPDNAKESPPTRKKKGKVEEVDTPESESALPAEEFHGGKPGSDGGRRFSIQGLPGP